MAYPTVAQSYESGKTPLGSNKIDIAENGTPRARSFHTATTYNIAVVHEMITSVEMQSIVDCYTSVQSSTVAFVWNGDGATYNCIFNGEPNPRPIPGGLWSVECRLTGQKA